MDKDFGLNERDILRALNGIKLPDNELANLNEEVPDVQRERIKKALKKRIKGSSRTRSLKYAFAAAAVGVVCLIGASSISPAFAKNIPVVGSIIQFFNDKTGAQGDYAEYSQMVNKSVTDSGITFTIKEALADDSRFIISYTIKSGKKINNLEVFNLDEFIKLNNKPVTALGSGKIERFIDEHTYVASEEIDIDTLDLPGRFNVDINVNEIMDVRGSWNFAFTLSRGEIDKKIVAFEPNKRVDFQDSTVTVDKVVFSPIGTYISISGNYKEKRETTPGNIFEYDYWLAYDDKGVELVPNGVGAGTAGTDKQRDFYCKMSYAKVNEIPEYITVIPCRITPTGGGGINLDNGEKINIETREAREISKGINGEYPIELPQGNFGKLIIKEVKTENNETKVIYTAEGKAPYFQASHLYIKDNRGKRIEVENRDIRRDEQKPNEFIMVFKALDPGKQYSVCTTSLDNVQLREDLKFRIELDK